MPSIPAAFKNELLRYADGRASADGRVETPIEGLGMMRSFTPSGPMHSLYQPLVCLVLGGAKQVFAHSSMHEFVAGQSLLVGVDQPVVGHVTRASREEPYLALRLSIDMAVMRDVMGTLSAAKGVERNVQTVFAEETREALLDCALRLVRLLARPEAVAVLRPAIMREMHYWLLAGPHGEDLRRLASAKGHAARIASAIAILRTEFNQSISVARLAAAAGMSISSFHQHFRAVTSLTPLQFQKHLRLTGARHLVLGGTSVGLASSAVGYESVSQFTREYGRMFGVTPRRDADCKQAA